MQISVTVQEADFDVAELNRGLQNSSDEVGALATFIGCMRGNSSHGEALTEMLLEHYPAMTEQCIREIVEEAVSRWPLIACKVVHRVGAIRPGEQIVYVGVASEHRHAAFESCEYIMDYLKSRAPFWKKERRADGSSHWLDARDSDRAALERWDK